MPIEISKIEQLAPDQASLAASAKLKKAGLWPLLACDASGTIWGECQGSGAAPYRVVCSELDLGYKCTCPSRKFPCKHVLALLWIRADGALAFHTAAAPPWVGDWQARRRPGAAPRGTASDSDGSVKASAAQAAATTTTPAPTPVDPKAEARAQAQRERTRTEREASIADGLDELDTWIADALHRGLATFLPDMAQGCRKIVQRLVDAKAPDLAGLVERLPTDVLSVSESMRMDALIESLARLHLIARAYRNRACLPNAVKADLRQVVGWPVPREALLSDPDALRVRDRWMVVSTVVDVQADKLRRMETWLSRLGDDAAPRFAVLTDFLPVSMGKVASTYRAGEAFDAELTYFVSPAPLRAVVAEQFGSANAEERWPRPADNVTSAVGRLGEWLTLRPWVGDLPFAAHGARIVESGKSLWLTDAAGAVGLPLRADEEEVASPLADVGEIDVFGRWDGHFLSLGLAETGLGRWTA